MNITRPTPLAFALVFAALLVAPSAQAACTAPSGAYAGAGGGANHINGASVTGVPTWPVKTEYQSGALTITAFPTRSAPGSFKLQRNISFSPADGHKNSLQSVTGEITTVAAYDPATCSGEFTLTGDATARSVTCDVFAVFPIRMNCSLGAPQSTPFKMRMRYTSSQGGARVTLTPLGVFAPEVYGFSYEMWRQ